MADFTGIGADFHPLRPVQRGSASLEDIAIGPERRCSRYLRQAASDLPDSPLLAVPEFGVKAADIIGGLSLTRSCVEIVKKQSRDRKNPPLGRGVFLW